MRQYLKVYPRIARSIKLGTPKKRFELTEKQIERLKTVGEVVLAVATIAGGFSLNLIAPNIFETVNKTPWARKTYRSRDTKWKDQQRKITQSIYYLKRHGYVQLIPEGEDFKVKITKRGRKKVRRMQFENLQVSIPKSWDGKWWIVVADVPKEYRYKADEFREKLKAMYFYPLQRTVWAFPFDSRDEVDFVAAYYWIERFVTLMEVSRLDPEDEGNLKKFFKQNKILA